MIVNWTVPINKFMCFHYTLCQEGGRYLSNPVILDDVVEVKISIDDFNKIIDALDRYPNDVIEIRRDQWWRKILRRFGVKC